MARRASTRWVGAGIALALTLGIAGPAAAGDRALLDVIGYSEDGRYFAFEEFGIQDGSGFPYSNIFVIDLSADSWVGGSPFRLRTDADNAALQTTRRDNRQAADDALTEFGITEPAQVLALIGDGEPADATELHFGAAGYGPGEVLGNYSLGLDVFEAKAGDAACTSYTEQPIVGFALTLGTDGNPRELHRDTTVPKSRGCPLAYRLYGVVGMANTGNIDGAVALISVYPLGFEGPDRRFIAVPIGQ